MRRSFGAWWRCKIQRKHYPCRGCTPRCGLCAWCNEVIHEPSGRDGQQ